jgi:hypothetical protein
MRTGSTSPSGNSATKGPSSDLVQNRKVVRQDLPAGPAAAPSAAQRAAEDAESAVRARAERALRLEAEIRIPITMRSVGRRRWRSWLSAPCTQER